MKLEGIGTMALDATSRVGCLKSLCFVFASSCARSRSVSPDLCLKMDSCEQPGCDSGVLAVSVC